MRGQDLRKMKAANGGNIDAFAHILDLAYGRKGKLKWEIMEVRHYLIVCLNIPVNASQAFAI
jgi:hypothetical protein